MQCLMQLDATTFQISEVQPLKYTECTFLLTSGVELPSNPFNLTIDEGQQLASAILYLWAIAFIWRTLSKLLESFNTKESEN